MSRSGLYSYPGQEPSRPGAHFGHHLAGHPQSHHIPVSMYGHPNAVASQLYQREAAAAHFQVSLEWPFRCSRFATFTNPTITQQQQLERPESYQGAEQRFTSREMMDHHAAQSQQREQQPVPRRRPSLLPPNPLANDYNYPSNMLQAPYGNRIERDR